MQFALSFLEGYRHYLKRHVGSLAIAAGVGAAGASGLYYLYQSTRGEDWALSSSQQGLYGSAAARQSAQAEADENLASHFISVQSISDSTTLPQMLEELERHLNRAASLDALILQLRQLRGPAEQIAPLKHALWRELAESGFARLAATIWLLPLLQLLLRVQLNILGRQLFVESNLLEPRGRPGSWKAVRLSTQADQLVRVGKGAQEQFLEYAHYLPERSVQAAVDRQKLAGFAVLESTELAQDMSAEQVHSLLEEMSSEFEEAVQLGGGWTELALPSEEEAQRYFASFRRAPPDNSALVPGTQIAITDEEIVKALVAELVQVMSSAPFAAALKASVDVTLKAVHDVLRAELGEQRLPLAKMVPRVSHIGDALLKPDGSIRQPVLESIAALPEVRDLAASVYSFGPA
ncbi:g13360 [Coccomyxa viridis]|uniref:G13360 protein n=1 Tax=Coccomyxa viridis TaxID=1274662 RepID=A0ABP1GCN1_9CHLO